jgi:hypothetical protein
LVFAIGLIPTDFNSPILKGSIQMNLSLRILFFCAVLALSGLTAPQSAAKVLQVGPGKRFAAPCQAIHDAGSGDTIEIDSSRGYKGDTCSWKTNRLTIRGIGPARASIDAAGKSAEGKAIWVISGDDTVIENIEFSGAAVSDGNGAAIRQEGANLTIRNCFFHDNEEGILAGDNPKSSILIEFSEFAQNGSGDGRTHNIYVNHVAKFTMKFCYSHHAKVGHLVKTRAAENFILYNRLSDEADGTASFELDISNGGNSYVIGNIIQQGPETQNSSILAYRMEGSDARNPGSQLYVINNTFVNDRPEGAIFLQIKSDTPKTAVVLNNIFCGKGTITTQNSSLPAGNLVTNDPGFVDAAHYDYRLRPNSRARGAGIQPQVESAFPLLPDQQYLHPACGASRSNEAKPDLGAIAFAAPGQRLGPARCQTSDTNGH